MPKLISIIESVIYTYAPNKRIPRDLLIYDKKYRFTYFE